jgi:hypothetical protein
MPLVVNRHSKILTYRGDEFYDVVTIHYTVHNTLTSNSKTFML